MKSWQDFNLFHHLLRCSSVADEVSRVHGLPQMLIFLHVSPFLALKVMQSSCSKVSFLQHRSPELLQGESRILQVSKCGCQQRICAKVTLDLECAWIKQD